MIIDLSYDGCRIEPQIALFPGVKFRMHVLGMQCGIDATVKWCKAGFAGVAFHSNGDKKIKVPRRSERIVIEAELSVRRAGRNAYRVQISDLTPLGCRVEFVEKPRPGEILWVKFDMLDGVEAKVMWVDGFSGGLEFARPIYLPVFELLLQRLQQGQPGQ